MTQTASLAPTGATMPAVQIAWVPSEWTPTTPYVVRHTEFGHYMSFRNFDTALDYAIAVAGMMNLEVQIVAR